MEKNKILQASLLDIVFDDRNKVYGAYELRYKYSRRLSTALMVTGALALVVLLASFVGAKLKTPEHLVPLNIKDVELAVLKEEPPIEIPPPVPPKAVEPPPVQMTQYATPRVVDDHLVTPEDEMKDVDVIKDTKIGTVTVDGDKNLDIVAPPVDDKRSGVVTGPKEDEDKGPALIVQIQAKFPGGEDAWRRYISREIEKHLDELQEDGKAGSCMVQFVVDVNGSISDVEALTMKGTKLAELCMNAIRKGPNWTPAENNGKKVKAYRRQPVVFQLMNE